VSHVTLRESRCTCRWVMSYPDESHDSHKSEMIHLTVWRDSSSQYATHFIYVCHMSHIDASHRGHIQMSHVRHLCESCRTGWVMSHIYASRVTSHVEVSRVTYQASHVTHLSESCHISRWVMSHQMSYVTHMWVTSHVEVSHVAYQASHVTHLSESCHTSKWVMSHI